MTTRRKFTGGLLASGMLANFALVAAPKDKDKDKDKGKDKDKDKDKDSGNNGNPCNGHGKADQCHGNGAKADTVTPPNPCKSSARMGEDQTPPPACKSASGKEDHVE